MKTMKFILTVTLKSDLCAANGDGFSSVIDTDVCCDKDGLPVIPARRLKGCMREICELFFDKDVAGVLFGKDSSFGWEDSDVSAAVRLDDARLKNRDDVLVSLKGLSPKDRLELFTYIKANTAIGDLGHAQDDTLRFTRAVRHYLTDSRLQCCCDNDELQFEAVGHLENFESQIEESGETYEEAFEATVGALRNIGYKRNVGFGAVSCILERLSEGDSDNKKQKLEVTPDTNVINYTVRLEGPVMVPRFGNGATEPFIPGQTVMGYFANRIWKKLCEKYKDSAQEKFDKLFLSNDFRSAFFSALYPVDALEKRCLPAVPVIAKVKGGSRDGDYYNLLDNFKAEEGETPKPLRDGFLSPTDYKPVEVSEKIEYHHSVKDKILYTQRCLCEGQKFSGFIVGDKNLLQYVLEVLDEGELFLGRSKSAQYSRCRVTDTQPDRTPIFEEFKTKEHAQKPKNTVLSRMESTLSNKPNYMILLDSDVLISDETGSYSTDVNKLAQAVLECFGLKGCFEPDLEARGSYLQTITVTGFNAKWGQIRPQVQAFKAGGCLMLKPNEKNTFHTIEMDKEGLLGLVGVRHIEGYGCVRLIDANNLKPSNHDEKKPSVVEGDNYMKCIDYARNTSISSFNPTFLSRVLQMAKESNKNDEFDKRLNSIKDEKRKKKACNLIKEFNSKIIDNSQSDWDMYKKLLIFMLTFLKYRLKSEEKGVGDD